MAAVRAGASYRFLAVAIVACGLASWADAAQAPSADPGRAYAPADIAFGARLYAAQCSTCHGPNGDGVGGVDFRSGKFRNGSTDQDLIRIISNGIQGTGMTGFRLNPPELTGLVAYVRNINAFDPAAVRMGDAARGQSVLQSRNCLQCHRVEGKGARVAPDLSDIGAIRSAGSLQRSLVDPTSQMMPINRPVRAVTRDGKVVNGRRLNEDTYSVQLIDDQERLVSFMKADLREFTVLTTSLMPAYKDLPAEELADLLAYLLSLQGR